MHWMMTSTINLSSGNFEIARSGRRTRRARRADKGESEFDGTKSSNPRITRNWHKYSNVSTLVYLLFKNRNSQRSLRAFENFKRQYPSIFTIQSHVMEYF